MNTTTPLVVALIWIATMAGCKKDEEIPSIGTTPTVVNPLRRVFIENLANATQEFTLDASTGGLVQGHEGVRVTFGAEAFLDHTGSVVTGAVHIELVEAKEVGDMVWLNKQTMGDDHGQLRPLVSGGQIYLNAMQGDQQLFLAPEEVEAWIPSVGQSDTAMTLFSGNLDINGEIVWTEFPNPVIQSSYTGGGFIFQADSLGWLNCDYFPSITGTQSTIQVTCPFGYSSDNTFVWLVFPDQNSATSIDGSTANVFSTGTSYQVPSGWNVIVVALSNIDGVISSSFTNAVVTQGLNISINFESTTLAQFQEDAQGL